MAKDDKNVIPAEAGIKSKNGSPIKSGMTSGKSKGNNYDPHKIEKYWQEIWLQEKIYEPDLDNAKKPFYNLMMFPYPSAEGLHVGSFFTYGGIDAFGRFKRMQGYDVFEPIGLDGFGIHSENYAIKVGRTPQQHAKISEENFYRQLHLLGNAYAWNHKLETYDPKYYKWTQWLFTELFKAGLAYKDTATVNFCPSCKTVLSDEQVINGKCERCSNEVEKRELQQWFFKITEYAERLLNNTEKLDWTEKVKIAQKNWIGKKVGAKVVFKIAEGEGESNTDLGNLRGKSIEVFTTRPDTLYGATFVVVSPEHPVIDNILKATVDEYRKKEIIEYRKAAGQKSEQDRIAEDKEKTGVFTGVYVTNPVNNEQIPVWIADYVLFGYGTGAIMAVPAHDQRDFDFAMKYELPIKTVIATSEDIAKGYSPKPDAAYVGEGVIVSSNEWNGWKTPESIERVTDWLEKTGFGKKSVNYHLRDWLISRQRYWGPPIPMIYCKECADRGQSWYTTKEEKGSGKEMGISNIKYQISNKQIDGKSAAWNAAGWYPVPLEDLPVILPVVEDFKPLGTGKAPLANYPEFYETKCPGCGGKATRETDVSDTFLDSSWYFFRYLATDWDNLPFPMLSSSSRKRGSMIPGQAGNDIAEKRLKWLPVSSYIGGAEHAVLHLLYSRFVTMVLNDLGYIDFDEPYTKFRANGLIIKDGAKMSKSKGNVINPDDYIRKFGSDTLRTYLGFIGPFTQGGDFQDSGIEGINRFLKRVWTLVSSIKYQVSSISKDRELLMHKTIKGVTEDMEELRFNTAIAKIMTYYNFLSDQKEISLEEVEVLLKLLAPFAPHMTEELYQKLRIENGELRNKSEKLSAFNSRSSIHKQPWPLYDASKIVSDTLTVAIQVNGKLRGTVQVGVDAGQEEVEKTAKEQDTVKRHIDGKTIRKAIYVKGKIINFVI